MNCASISILSNQWSVHNRTNLTGPYMPEYGSYTIVHMIIYVYASQISPIRQLKNPFVDYGCKKGLRDSMKSFKINYDFQSQLTTG